MSDTICEVCGSVQGMGDGFCAQCGGRLHAIRYCEGCGIPLPPKVAFCRECGTPAPKAAPVSRPVNPAPASPGTETALRTPPLPTRAPARTNVPRRAAQPPAPTPTVTLPAAPPAGSSAQILGSALVGAAGLALLAMGGTAAVGGVVMLPVALGLSWRQWQYYTASAAGKVVDWMWERPAMRRRILGE